MPLESCMILLDNSEFMRNGDYIPTRLEAQSDAANMIVNQKTQSNPESTVGVIAMSSSGPSSGAELLVSPTDDLGKILSALHGVPLCGEMVRNGKDAVDIAASVQVATLALKHRRNKNGAQRIVLFVGSPLSCAEARSFIKAGKQLKKNNVFIDVIAMGELGENEPKLRELVDAANGSSANEEGAERNCHLVTIPAGVLPSDVLITSPIFRGDGAPMGGDMGGAAAGAGGGGGDGFAEYGGVDPNMDPELAMALRVSMEEERARQERVSAAAAESNQEEKSGDGEDDAAAANNAESMEGITAGVENDEDALLQQALAMSMAENQAPSTTEETTAAAGESTAMDMGDDDDDAAMQMALAMSMQGESEEKTDAGLDPAFVNQLLGSLPGVNPDDPAIQEALRKAKDESEKKGDEKEDKEE
mmetsp:Transcript_6687/g.10206  ORF Transcript_6687/g.10206 Transcript_6687/m.10206 type:complete len:418 (+) Transcript_6687:92-1345(+)|eukprot:scaffold36526_cov139-Skeletonema_dohrnii-CCMP3373.AAC.15